MCFNWKVLAGLGVVGVGLYVVNPGLVLGALPFLLLAACPLSMLLMGKSMGGMQGMGGAQQPAQLAGAAGQGQRYTCPMHPEVRSAQPGRCPTCGMGLVPSAAPTHESAPAVALATAMAEPGVGVSREAQLGLLRAQLQVLNEQQAALAAHLERLQEAEPPSKALVEAERIAQAAATRP